jgi:hypothetical protein
MSAVSEVERPAPAAAPDTAEPAARVVRAVMGVNVALAVLLTFFICLIPIAVTDFWWQAKTGELIVRNGAIPTRDPFSWTSAGQPWLVHEWLTEVFFYLALARMPDWVLLFYKSGLAALVCALVLVRGWARSGSLVLGIGAAMVAAYVLRNYADLRPQMVTFVLLAGMLLALDEYREGRLKKLPWVLPFVFALWANLHGGVIVGLILITLWVVGDALGMWLFRQQVPGLPRLGLAVAASFLAVALNPNGFHVYAYPFQVLGHPKVMDYITEWFSPSLHNATMRPFFLLLLSTFGLLALVRGGRRVGELLVLLAMAFAALQAQRNTAPFAVAAAPAAAAAVGLLWKEAAPLAPLREITREALVQLAGAVVLAGALLGLTYYHLPRDANRRLLAPGHWYAWGIKLHEFPVQATQLMKEGMWPGRIYNDYVWGGYLIWHLYPRQRVFIDGRAEVYYPTGAFDDEMIIHQATVGWPQALDRRGVDVILTARGGNLATALQWTPQWRLAFTGSVEVVYVRASPR